MTDFTAGLSTAITTGIPIVLAAAATVAGVVILLPMAKKAYGAVVGFLGAR